MKNSVFVIMFIFIIILLTVIVFGAIYMYMQFDKKDMPKKNDEVGIYKPEEKLNPSNQLNDFLFTDKSVKLFYEGGPSHWGSKTVTFTSEEKTSNGKIINLNVVDESNMKDGTKKEVNQKWETKLNELYIDDVLMLRSPIIVGKQWSIANYSPVLFKDKKYTAKVVITDVQNSLDTSNKEVKKVTTKLTVDDIKTVDGDVYAETRVFESGIGLKEFKVIEPTTSGLELSYWLESKK